MTKAVASLSITRGISVAFESVPQTCVQTFHIVRGLATGETYSLFQFSAVGASLLAAAYMGARSDLDIDTNTYYRRIEPRLYGLIIGTKARKLLFTLLHIFHLASYFGSVFWPPHVYCTRLPLRAPAGFCSTSQQWPSLKYGKGRTQFSASSIRHFFAYCECIYFCWNYIRAIAHTSFAIFYVLRKALHVARSIRLLCRFCDGFGRASTLSTRRRF